MRKGFSLAKEVVCDDCQSPIIIYKNCRCTYDRQYPTIVLEFYVCDCCGQMESSPTKDSEFNQKQWKAYETNTHQKVFIEGKDYNIAGA
jgi:RNase P subunit RPR2